MEYSMEKVQNSTALSLAWSKLIDDTTHALTSPIAALRMTLSLIEKTMPELLEKCRSAIQQESLESDYSDNQLNTLENIIPNIRPLLNRLTEILQQLHPWNKKILQPNANAPLDIKTGLEATIKNYQFDDESQRRLIQLSTEINFSCPIDMFFLEHAIGWFIANALKKATQGLQSLLSIWTVEQPNFYELHLLNANQCMTPQTINYLLDKFFMDLEGSSSKKPGLGYCRLALLQIGGNLNFETSNSDQTHAILNFPKCH